MSLALGVRADHHEDAHRTTLGDKGGIHLEGNHLASLTALRTARARPARIPPTVPQAGRTRLATHQPGPPRSFQQYVKTIPATRLKSTPSHTNGLQGRGSSWALIQQTPPTRATSVPSSGGNVNN